MRIDEEKLRQALVDVYRGYDFETKVNDVACKKCKYHGSSECPVEQNLACTQSDEEAIDIWLNQFKERGPK